MALLCQNLCLAEPILEQEADSEPAELYKARGEEAVTVPRTLPLNLFTPEPAAEVEADLQHSSDHPSGKKKLVDIRDFHGKDYINLLFAEEDKLNCEFVNVHKQIEDEEKQLTNVQSVESEPAAEKYEFGKTYDFHNVICEKWPTFDYEKLDAQKIRDNEQQERELKKYATLLLKDTSSDVADEFAINSNRIGVESEVDDVTSEVAALEDRLFKLGSLESEELEDLHDTCSYAASDLDAETELSEGGDNENEHWTRTLKRQPKKGSSLLRKVGLSKLKLKAPRNMWLSSSNHKHLKARRDLRGALGNRKIDSVVEGSMHEINERPWTGLPRTYGNRNLRCYAGVAEEI